LLYLRISTRWGAGVRQLDVLDFAYGFGLMEKIVKGNGIKRYKKGWNQSIRERLPDPIPPNASLTF
jgi:hypothetical protein